MGLGEGADCRNSQYRDGGALATKPVEPAQEFVGLPSSQCEKEHSDQSWGYIDLKTALKRRKKRERTSTATRLARCTVRLRSRQGRTRRLIDTTAS